MGKQGKSLTERLTEGIGLTSDQLDDVGYGKCLELEPGSELVERIKELCGPAVQEVPSGLKYVDLQRYELSDRDPKSFRLYTLREGYDRLSLLELKDEEKGDRAVLSYKRVPFVVRLREAGMDTDELVYDMYGWGGLYSQENAEFTREQIRAVCGKPIGSRLGRQKWKELITNPFIPELGKGIFPNGRKTRYYFVQERDNYLFVVEDGKNIVLKTLGLEERRKARLESLG